jgi:hypothetical protein
MNTWEIVWYWVEDGCICGKVIFSADNEEAAIKEWEQRVKLATYGWYEIVKREEI